MEADVANRDPIVFADEVRWVQANFPSMPPSLATQVRQLVGQTLREFACSREHIAEMLGLQTRTLHRRLRREGTSFEAIRDDVRRGLLLRYLSRHDLTLTDVEARLGYSEIAVLSRRCRRWFARSPSGLRRDLISSQMRH